MILKLAKIKNTKELGLSVEMKLLFQSFTKYVETNLRNQERLDFYGKFNSYL